MNDAVIRVRFALPGFHSWPDAPDRRAYLRDVHRHVFHVEVCTHVSHDDREIEFHDLQDEAREIFESILTSLTGPRSCEHMARVLGAKLREHHKRTFEVTVWEDNECGATVLS